MKCVLTGQNAISKRIVLPLVHFSFFGMLKANLFLVLARVIHSFSRIGNELFIEADSRNGLSLRTINMTKSAFSMIMFNMDFFTSFRINPKADEFENQCKLSMKSCLSVFRNMKQVCTQPKENSPFQPLFYSSILFCFWIISGGNMYNNIR